MSEEKKLALTPRRNMAICRYIEAAVDDMIAEGQGINMEVLIFNAMDRFGNVDIDNPRREFRRAILVYLKYFQEA